MFKTQTSGIACATCHGDDGASGFAIDIPEIDFHSLSLADFERVVRNGGATMPGVSAGRDGYSDIALNNDYAYFAYPELCGEEVDDEPVTPASCAAEADLVPAQLRRLTRVQFKNTVIAALGGTYSDSVWPQFNDATPTIGVSNNADALGINAINFESIYNSASAIAEAALSSNVTAAKCLAAGGSNCVGPVLDDVGPKLWRRPLTAAERNQIISGAERVGSGGGDAKAKLRFTLQALIMNPAFLYRSEIGTERGDLFELTSYEIASLLSYSLWDGPPDQTLYQLAAQDALKQPATLKTQIERMLQDKRFDQALVNFYRDFLKLDRVTSVTKLSELQFTDSKRTALLASAERSLIDQVADRDRDILSVLDIDRFYVNGQIASLFGATSSSSSLEAIALPNGQRNGLLTHPAFLSVHSKEGGSGIVKRGVFTLEQLLCVELGDPPPNTEEAPLPPDVNPATTSTRELLSIQHTSQVPCNSCHQIIDPAGFGFENYDALGKFRTVEKGSVPIDSSGSITTDSGETLAFDDHIEFTSAIMQSPTVRSCLSRRFLEHVMGRGLEADSCEVQRFGAGFDDESVSIRELVTRLATLESMRLRQ